MIAARRLLAAHWYAPALLLILAAVWLLARMPAFMSSGGEVAIIADLCLTAPALYAFCYAHRQPLRHTVVRTIAIACAGLWLAAWIIPASQQVWLPVLAPLRWIGLALVAWFELRLVIASIRLAFSGSATSRDLVDASGAPEWIARLMLWEAGIWRRLWRALRKRDKGGR